MNKYFIHAMEGAYHGLHGIETYLVEEAEKEEDLYFDGEMASRELMESYGSIMEDIYEEAEESDNSEEMIEALIEENIEYYIYKIKNNVDKTCRELDAEACRLGADLFIEEYCEKE